MSTEDAPEARERTEPGLVDELEAKAWQSSSRRNHAGDLSRHTDHVCWRAAAHIKEAAAELARLREENARLHERLEDNHAFVNGERVEVGPGFIPDGIACRDETIKGQDEQIAKLVAARDAARSQLAEAVKALEFYADPQVYAPHPHGPAFDRRDISSKARSTLARFDGKVVERT